MAKVDFLGVYSSQNKLSGLGVKGSSQKQLWFVWQVEMDKYICQPIDASYSVTSVPHKLEKIEFDTRYTLEPKIFAAPLHALSPQLVEEVLANTGNNSEKESSKALNFSPAQILDMQLKEDFALQIQKLRRGKKHEASMAIQGILERKQGIIAAHKHLFTELGIELRALDLMELSCKSFERAYTLDSTDPNTAFNLARIYFQSGKIPEAQVFTDKVLALEANHKLALILKERIKKSIKNSPKLKA